MPARPNMTDRGPSSTRSSTKGKKSLLAVMWTLELLYVERMLNALVGVEYRLPMLGKGTPARFGVSMASLRQKTWFARQVS